MALEQSPNNIVDELNADNPTGSDGIGQGDNHIRLIKKVLKGMFPGMKKHGTIPLHNLTFNSALVWDAGTNPNAKIVLTGNVSSLTVNNMLDGSVCTLIIQQDSAGSRTFAFPSAWKWPTGTEGTIFTAANVINIATIRRLGSDIFAYSLLRGLA